MAVEILTMPNQAKAPYAAAGHHAVTAIKQKIEPLQAE